MDAVDKMVCDVNNLYNTTTFLYTSLSYHQLVLHIRSVLANLWDSLSYIRTVSMHTMDYINKAATRTLSPHILPIADLKQMLYEHGCFSFCLFICGFSNFLKNRIYILSKDNLLPVPNMASSGQRKMLILIIFQHWIVYKCWCVLQFCGHLMG